MAKPGPRPEATASKIARGNPGKRPINENEIKPEIKIPTAPAFLGARALTEWRRVSKLLLKHGLISDMDRSILAAYCDAYEIWIETRSQLRKENYTVPTQTGGMKVNPLATISAQARAEMVRISREFGLSPTARVGLEAGFPAEKEPEGKSEFEKFKEARAAAAKKKGKRK